MHSKIFQISKGEVKDFITEDRYIDGFVGQIADYVQEMDKEVWKETWNWLSDFCKGAIEINENKLTVIDKEKYFANRYTDFQLLIKKAADISLEQFMSNDYTIDITDQYGNTFKRNAPSLMCDIGLVFDDKLGFYVDDNDGYAGLETFDSFMRRVHNGDVYYLGSVIDYHF